MNQQGAQVTVAAFADTQQDLLAAGRVLFGYQPQPSRQLSAIFEIVRVADRRYQHRRADRPNPRNLGQPPTDGVLTVPLFDLAFQVVDVLIKCLEMLAKASHKFAKPIRQFILGIFENVGQMPANGAQPLWNDNAKLTQQAADLVALGGARFDKALAGAMQC